MSGSAMPRAAYLSALSQNRLSGKLTIGEILLRDKKLEAAADKLYSIGLRHGWWGKKTKSSWRDLDSIGRDKFLDATKAVVEAYRQTPDASSS